MRMLVAPTIVASTIFLFGTGVALLALDRTSGTIVGLHKASFLVWFGATGVHVLAYLLRLPRLLAARVPGLAVRVVLVAAAVLSGVAIATMTLPKADHLQDNMTSIVGIDAQ